MERIPSLNWAVAEVIDRLRNHVGLTQSQLAGLAGLSVDYISAMERGKQCGSLTAMAHIASALGVSLTDLVGQIDAAHEAGPKPPNRKSGQPAKREPRPLTRDDTTSR